MSAEDVLAKLCRNEDTLQAAQGLFRRAKARTGRGSGFDLGANNVALPAICAYKASQSLNNDDVSRSAAQAASCIAPNQFDDALHKVDAALCDTRRSMTVLSYPDIIRKHPDHIRASSALLSLLGKAEDALETSGRGKKYKEHDKMPSILFWVCKQKSGEDMFKRTSFCRMHSVALPTLEKIVGDLDKHADALKKQAEKLFQSPPAASRPSSPTKAPAKRELPHGGSPHKKAAPMRELPHGGSPHKKSLRELPHGGSPPKPHASPRKAPPPLPALFPTARMPSSAESGSDDEADLLSPRKRRKVEAPMGAEVGGGASSSERSPNRARAAPTRSRASPAKPAVSVDAAQISPRRSTRVPEVEDVVIVQTRNARKNNARVDDAVVPSESDAGDEDRSLPRRRFRPVFLDAVQWSTRDAYALKLEQSRLGAVQSTA